MCELIIDNGGDPTNGSIRPGEVVVGVGTLAAGDTASAAGGADVAGGGGDGVGGADNDVRGDADGADGANGNDDLDSIASKATLPPTLRPPPSAHESMGVGRANGGGATGTDHAGDVRGGAPTKRAGTPLFWAAARGRIGTVRALLKHAMHTVDARSDDGDSALWAAIANSHLATAVALLEAGADPTVTNRAKLNLTEVRSLLALPGIAWILSQVHNTAPAAQIRTHRPVLDSLETISFDLIAPSRAPVYPPPDHLITHPVGRSQTFRSRASEGRCREGRCSGESECRRQYKMIISDN